MVLTGHVKNGAVIFDQPVVLPEGLRVCVEVPETDVPSPLRPSRLRRPANDS